MLAVDGARNAAADDAAESDDDDDAAPPRRRPPPPPPPPPPLPLRAPLRPPLPLPPFAPDLPDANEAAKMLVVGCARNAHDSAPLWRADGNAAHRSAAMALGRSALESENMHANAGSGEYARTLHTTVNENIKVTWQYRV